LNTTKFGLTYCLCRRESATDELFADKLFNIAVDARASKDAAVRVSMMQEKSYAWDCVRV